MRIGNPELLAPASLLAELNCLPSWPSDGGRRNCSDWMWFTSAITWSAGAAKLLNHRHCARFTNQTHGFWGIVLSKKQNGVYYIKQTTVSSALIRCQRTELWVIKNRIRHNQKNRRSFARKRKNGRKQTTKFHEKQKLHLRRKGHSFRLSCRQNHIVVIIYLLVSYDKVSFPLILTIIPSQFSVTV